MQFNTLPFDFELISPARKMVSEPVVHAVLPGQEGELGIGAGHSSLLAALKAGTVKLFHAGQDEPVKIFIAGGFADVTGARCTVLAEEAVNVNDIDINKLEQEFASLRNDLDRSADEAEKTRLSRKLAYAAAKYHAVTGRMQII